MSKAGLQASPRPFKRVSSICGALRRPIRQMGSSGRMIQPKYLALPLGRRISVLSRVYPLHQSHRSTITSAQICGYTQKSQHGNCAHFCAQSLLSFTIFHLQIFLPRRRHQATTLLCHDLRFNQHKGYSLLEGVYCLRPCPWDLAQHSVILHQGVLSLC